MHGARGSFRVASAAGEEEPGTSPPSDGVSSLPEPFVCSRSKPLTSRGRPAGGPGGASAFLSWPPAPTPRSWEPDIAFLPRPPHMGYPGRHGFPQTVLLGAFSEHLASSPRQPLCRHLHGDALPRAAFIPHADAPRIPGPVYVGSLTRSLLVSRRVAATSWSDLCAGLEHQAIK